jgi:hypothetical protein
MVLPVETSGLIKGRKAKLPERKNHADDGERAN